jgi:hypothetical protein
VDSRKHMEVQCTTTRGSCSLQGTRTAPTVYLFAHQVHVLLQYIFQGAAHCHGPVHLGS